MLEHKPKQCVQDKTDMLTSNPSNHSLLLTQTHTTKNNHVETSTYVIYGVVLNKIAIMTEPKAMSLSLSQWIPLSYSQSIITTFSITISLKNHVFDYFFINSSCWKQTRVIVRFVREKVVKIRHSDYKWLPFI